MELMALIKALEWVSSNLSLVRGSNAAMIVIHTDNQGLVDNYPRAINVWRNNKFTKKGGEPVANTDLWRKVISILRKISIRVEIKKVKGHSFDIHNQDVDKLATKGVQSIIKTTFKKTNGAKKLSPLKTRRGVIKMSGQTIAIRIIEIEYLGYHKTYRLRYEVAEPNHPDFLMR